MSKKVRIDISEVPSFGRLVDPEAMRNRVAMELRPVASQRTERTDEGVQNLMFNGSPVTEVLSPKDVQERKDQWGAPVIGKRG